MAPRFYDIELRQEKQSDGNDVWSASHPDLLGCIATGETPSAAIAALAEVSRVWLERADEIGQKVPEPSTDYRYSYVLSEEAVQDDVDAAQSALRSPQWAAPEFYFSTPTL